MNIGNESQQIPLIPYRFCLCLLLEQATVAVIAFVDGFGVAAEEQAETFRDFPAEQVSDIFILGVE
jgi:hypothetical protein